MDDRLDASNSIYIIESGDRPGTYELFHDKTCILVYRKQKRGIEIVNNATGVSNEEVKLHIEAYVEEPEAIILYLSKLKYKTLRRLDRTLRKCLPFLDEEGILDVYRKLKYMEDVHK